MGAPSRTPSGARGTDGVPPVVLAILTNVVVDQHVDSDRDAALQDAKRLQLIGFDFPIAVVAHQSRVSRAIFPKFASALE
jgi:hypothetical protein